MPLLAPFYAALALLLPRLAGRLWARLPLWSAGLIAVLNYVLFYPTFVRLAAVERLQTLPVPVAVPYALLTLALGMLFFVVIPLAALPGSSRACLGHVLRVTFMATTFVHVWIGGFHLAADLRRAAHPTGYDLDSYFFYAAVAAGLLLYTTIFALRAAGVEYRRPIDMPPPPEPRCDRCGYDLRATPLDSRCPECGTPVQASLGPAARVPSPWEQNPSFLRLRTVLRQIGQMTVAPLSLYRAIPLHSGQVAARRWLGLMITLLGVLAFGITEGLRMSGTIALGTTYSDWQLYAVGLIFAAVWVFLALMMVGIETAGVVAAARFRGHHVDLGAAAKVTAYASTLLLFWVLLGGLQIIALFAYIELAPTYHFAKRYETPLAMGSLFAAHIGGLLWFELTVYRGLRAIQFANK